MNKEKDLEIHSLSFMDAVNCQLTIRQVDENIGVTRTKENEFDWEINIRQLRNVTIMLEDSLTSSGFYWLDESDCQTDIDLLFSQGGGW